MLRLENQPALEQRFSPLEPSINHAKPHYDSGGGVALATIELLANLDKLDSIYENALKRMQRLADNLSKPDPKVEIPFIPKRRKSTKSDVFLPSALKLIDRMQNPPLLPAPPTFEEAFAHFEPMFHTVFYRQYPYYLLADAKQEGLLHLWKKWKADMSLLDQTPAFVTQAGIWGAGNARKKRRKVEAHELPMLPYERYIDIRIADQSRDPGWMKRLDRTIDIELAVAHVSERLRLETNCEDLLRVLDDLIKFRPQRTGWRNTNLSFLRYKHERDKIGLMLREELAEYAPV